MAEKPQQWRGVRQIVENILDERGALPFPVLLDLAAKKVVEEMPAFAQQAHDRHADSNRRRLGYTARPKKETHIETATIGGARRLARDRIKMLVLNHSQRSYPNDLPLSKRTIFPRQHQPEKEKPTS